MENSEPELTGRESDTSFVGRVFGLFGSPRRAFDSILIRRETLVVFALVAIISGVLGVVRAPYEGQTQIDVLSKSTTIELSDEQIAEMQDISTGDRVTTFFTTILLRYCLSLTVVAALALFVGNILFGGDASYKLIFALLVYTSVIGVVGDVFRTGMMVLTDSPYIMTGLNAAHPTAQITSISYIVLSFFDLFFIWEMIVFGVGASVLYKSSTGRGITIAVISWVPLVLLGVGFAVLGMKMAGVPLSW